MKTILFFYFDVVLGRSIVDAYCVPSSDVEETIEWRRKSLMRDIREGYYKSLRIQIVDKFDFTMLHTFKS